MTSRPEPCTLLAASDLLSSVQALVEAAFMAAGSLGNERKLALYNRYSTLPTLGYLSSEVRRSISRASCAEYHRS